MITTNFLMALSNVKDVTNVFLYLATSIVLLLAILTIVCYKKISVISLALILILDTCSIVWGRDFVITLLIFFDVLFIIDIALSIVEFLLASFVDKALSHKYNDFLANTLYDYFYATNSRDRIKSASVSFMNLVSLDMSELKKSKGFQTLFSELKIIKINGREVTEEVALKLLFDYQKTVGYLNTYKFQLQIMIKEEPVFLQVIVQPLHFKGLFLGRHVYMFRDKEATINNLRENLHDAVMELENNKNQIHTLMSLSKNIIMYYDFSNGSYVATEALNSVLGVSQKEFTIEEFFGMIHPDDLNFYQEQGSVINSIVPNRTKIRLFLNNTYYEVFDDALYLNKDSNLVSVISLVDKEEVPKYLKKTPEPSVVSKLDELEMVAPVKIMDELLKESNVKKDDINDNQNEEEDEEKLDE